MKSMKSRTIVIGVILACSGLAMVVIAACAGFWYFGFRYTDAALSPKIDALFAAIDNGTFGDTYPTETAPELRKAIGRKEWEQLGLAIRSRLGPLKAKNLTQFNIRQFNTDQSADAVYSATFEKGSGEIRTRFRNVDGEWRLVIFRVNSPEFLKDLSTVPCPHCGEVCPASAKFCPKCGKPITDHGAGKTVSKNDNPHVNGTTTEEVAPPAPPAR
jgi:hypothetical protein